MKAPSQVTALLSCYVVAATMLFAPATQAFQVLPKVSDVDRKLTRWSSNTFIDSVGQWFYGSAIPYMKSPVHEAITLSALGCSASAGNESSCITLDAVTTHRAILYGVRWPDDPPFRLSTSSPPRIPDCDPKVTLRSTAQPKCWYGLFRDAGKQAAVALKKNPDAPAFGPGDYLLYRSHFGDLQFMHSMGSFDGERAGDTLVRIKMWSKFLWGIAVGAVPVDRYLRDLGDPALGTYFPGDMTATNLFATGIVEVRKDLDKVAIGSLLHMLQDSFSEAHTERASETGANCPGTQIGKPGKIKQFYSYARQDGGLHDARDTFDALSLHTTQFSPSVVDASKALLTMWERKADWTEAEKVIDCFFELSDPEAKAGPGEFLPAQTSR